jgi:demethylmenaquinone methyltransferase / 2-methoxy-6-polyprenyl-1,4-benzoquinol methylase
LKKKLAAGQAKRYCAHHLQSNDSGETEPARVQHIFGSIASRYDLANHVLSCGVDFYWRRRAAQIVADWRATKILDVATGTGDLALAIARKARHAEVTGVDFSREMLARARQKGLPQTVLADAVRLPFANRSFDCVTIAFGLRNMGDYGAAIREMSRVLSKGGRLLILEFSLPRLWILRAVYRLYLHYYVPSLGSLITGKKSAYKYLGDSIEEFPSRQAMLQLIETNGFANTAAEPLTGGIVTIYTAENRL